ncbi:MAG: fibrillarin-like rRNA/tRNA 2'-O-methyltransferase [Candidatus Aenigmarchaeota archaeon]|nr:fibrillarin-like rRNA/tRNA 2'-O-methyltransferase [Candidatus Aenigmarchaeota archaeon]MCX8179184.1 fibrillarin-like rRNA/tRNA 2'-O-methyltransferase [Candidatus Aenigmarchaeota archaeon]
MQDKIKSEGIFWINGKLTTQNLTPGKQVYGEKLLKKDGKEYRVWVPDRSKPAAAIYKGLKKFPIKKGFKILYLGIASGTTSSHFSDIVGNEGIIYGIEISERVLRDLLFVAKERKNIMPILADARKPEEYGWIEEVDLVYADVAIPDMTDVLIRNCEFFLKEDGYAMIAIKSRSIDVVKKPNIVYKEEREKLEKFFSIEDFVTLDPFEKDHGFFVLKRKNQ